MKTMRQAQLQTHNKNKAFELKCTQGKQQVLSECWKFKEKIQVSMHILLINKYRVIYHMYLRLCEDYFWNFSFK